MDTHDRLLAAFLAGDLDRAEAQQWDEHLLACERCWRGCTGAGESWRRCWLRRG